MDYFTKKEQETIHKYESLRRRIWRKKKTIKEIKKEVGE